MHKYAVQTINTRIKLSITRCFQCKRHKENVMEGHSLIQVMKSHLQYLNDFFLPLPSYFFKHG